MTLIHIPGPLREFTAGAATIQLDEPARSVADALERLGRRYPGVRDRVLDERGEVRLHVNVFVGRDNIRDAGGLATPLPPGAEISIIQAVSGG